jgi:CRP/FNR family transcriptional regulator, cyclic AMP receptor protein
MVRRNAYAEHLAQVPLFSKCSKEELRRLAQRTTDIKVDVGQALIREKQGSYEFFVIVEGKAEVTRAGKKVATLGPGDFFGELGLLDRDLRDATVTARTAMEVIVLSQWDFEAALEDAPRMTRKLLAGMAHRLRELDRRT